MSELRAAAIVRPVIGGGSSYLRGSDEVLRATWPAIAAYSERWRQIEVSCSRATRLSTSGPFSAVGNRLGYHSASDPQVKAEIISSRFLPYPRDQLFDAFINPELLAEWWGPHGFTNEFDVFDPRPGGAWLFTMRAPDGSDHRMVKEFVEIVPLERIVVQHIEPLEHRFKMTMSFLDEPGGTRLTWRMAFESAEEDARVRPFVLEANEQNFDRLAALLDQRAGR